MADEETTLTPKQEAFVTAYLQNGFNGTRAAITAGYSEDSAGSIASENLTKPNVATAIKDRLNSEGITPERIQIALGEIAFGADIADFEDILTGEKPSVLREKGLATRLIKSVSYTKNGITLKMDARLDAIDKLAKVHGMYHENLDMTTNGESINKHPGLDPEDAKILSERNDGPKEK